MNIDITELMKTGLFELHYMRQGDSEEWSIIPTQKDINGTLTNEWYNIVDDTEWEFSTEDNHDPWYTTEDIVPFTWKNDIPWDKIPDEYDYVAMNENGEWWAYESKPSEDPYQWIFMSGDIYDLGFFDMPTPPHWTESLVRRPQ